MHGLCGCSKVHLSHSELSHLGLARLKRIWMGGSQARAHLSAKEMQLVDKRRPRAHLSTWKTHLERQASSESASQHRKHRLSRFDSQRNSIRIDVPARVFTITHIKKTEREARPQVPRS